MTNGAAPYSGEVVYFFAFDVAFEMRDLPLDRLLGQPVVEAPVLGDKRRPRPLPHLRPLQVVLPPLEVSGPHGSVTIQRTVKVLRVGAISICLRVPITGLALGDLIAYHDLRLGTSGVDALARGIALEVHRELMPWWVRPHPDVPVEEAYTVFCVHTPIRDTAEWLMMHRGEVAALLTQEEDPVQLSDQETEESVCRRLSYYRHDLVVLDWDAALLIDRPQAIDETLGIIELANLELAELEAYDRVLDGVVERAYRDVGSHRLGLRRGRVMRDLGELRIDLARSSDALGNITKLFGDWHLARIYTALGERFHLADWQRTIDAKLHTVDDLYQLLKQDQATRWMLVLEVVVVLLFIADLTLLVKR